MSTPGQTTKNESSGFIGDFPTYLSVAERRELAREDIKELRKGGKAITPVKLKGGILAETFWGEAWCENLERESDFKSRLPRARSYVRGGALIDLQIAPPQISALVRGHDLYSIDISITPMKPKNWAALLEECSGEIGSLLDLLSSKFPTAVAEALARPQTGLFPAPEEIQARCTCPDWAALCKHAAAALYGVASRLDRQPEILFLLRGVDLVELSPAAASIRKLETS